LYLVAGHDLDSYGGGKWLNFIAHLRVVANSVS
jgi:hypothetical protein